MDSTPIGEIEDMEFHGIMRAGTNMSQQQQQKNEKETKEEENLSSDDENTISTAGSGGVLQHQHQHQQQQQQQEAGYTATKHPRAVMQPVISNSFPSFVPNVTNDIILGNPKSSDGTNNNVGVGVKIAPIKENKRDNRLKLQDGIPSNESVTVDGIHVTMSDSYNNNNMQTQKEKEKEKENSVSTQMYGPIGIPGMTTISLRGDSGVALAYQPTFYKRKPKRRRSTTNVLAVRKTLIKESVEAGSYVHYVCVCVCVCVCACVCVFIFIICLCVNINVFKTNQFLGIIFRTAGVKIV